MNSIPICSYRWGDRYYVCDFIIPKNPDIQDVVAGFGNVEGDKFVEAVAAYIRDNFQYPLWNGNPTCDGQLLRYTQGPLKHGFKCCVYYVWAFPPEVIQSKLGYCAETGNLAESLLLSKVNSFAVLGDVLSTSDILLGRHEWVETPYKGEICVLETTIHTMGANTLATTKSVYDKNSDWAKQGGLYYSPKARFNNVIYEGSNEFITLMGLPAKRVFLSTLEETQKIKAKKLYKELRKENAIMQALLKQAWGA
jgi:hypothetical protein